MTEFKIDKLGWYQSADGILYNIIHKIDNFNYVMIEETLTYAYIVSEDGSSHTLPRIVKYVGKRPLKRMQFERMVYPITEYGLKKLVIACLSEDFFKMVENNFCENSRALRFKITMEEVPDDL